MRQTLDLKWQVNVNPFRLLRHANCKTNWTYPEIVCLIATIVIQYECGCWNSTQLKGFSKWDSPLLKAFKKWTKRTEYCNSQISRWMMWGYLHHVLSQELWMWVNKHYWLLLTLPAFNILENSNHILLHFIFKSLLSL